MLIIGSGHGFGKEIALSLVAMGCHVYACDGPKQEGESRIDDSGKRIPSVQEELDLLVEQCTSLNLPGSISVAISDFCSEESVREWTNTIIGQESRLDIIVLNAGGVLGNTEQRVEDVSMKSWDAIFQVNVRSSMVIVQQLAPLLKQSCRGNGRIITISSGAGVRASLTGIQAYCASKHAVVGLTRQLARELGPFGITVNSVAPGLCLTNENSERQWNGYSDEKQKQIVRGTAMQRLGNASDIANAVLFFASEASGWCSGQVLEVNGGR